MCWYKNNKNVNKNNVVKESFFSFTNTIQFVSSYLNSIALKECFILIVSQFNYYTNYYYGFGACIIQIFYYVNIINYTITLLFTQIFVIFYSIIMILLFYKYYNIYNPYNNNNNNQNIQNIKLNHD